MSRFLLFFFERPRAAWLLYALLTTAACAGLGRLKFNDDYLNLLRSPSPSFAALGESHAQFGSEVDDLLLVVDAPNVADPSLLASMRDLVGRLRDDAGIESVVSLLDLYRSRAGLLRPVSVVPEEGLDRIDPVALRDQILSHPLAADQIVSEDGTTTVIVVALATLEGGELPMPVLSERLSAVERHVEASGVREHARVRATGPPAIRVVTTKALVRDQARFSTAAVTIAVGVGYAMFPSWKVIVGIVWAPVTAVLWTLGAMGLVGLELNVVTGTIGPLLMAIALTDNIHFATDIRKRLEAGIPRTESVRSSIATLAGATALTSITTAIGFGSLTLAETELVREFGAVSACGVMAAFVAMSICTPRWGGTSWSDGVVERPRVPASIAPPRWLRAAWDRPLPLLTLTAVAVVGLIGLATRLYTDVRATTELPLGTTEHAAFTHLEEKMGGMLAAQVLVTWPESSGLGNRELREVVLETEQALAETPGASRPMSLAGLETAASGRAYSAAARGSLLAVIPKPLARRFVEPSARTTLVTSRMKDIGARAMRPELAKLESRLDGVRSRHPDYGVVLTGVLPVHVRTIARLIDTLRTSLWFAIGVIFFVLVGVFRSLRLAAASVLPNALPLLAIAAYLVAVGSHVGIAGALSFTVALGIAVDDTIHFLERYRTERRSATAIDAVVRAWSALSAVMLITTLVLGAGFATLLMSEFLGLRYFGGLSVLAMLTAVVGDLVVLPAWLVWRDGDRGAPTR